MDEQGYFKTLLWAVGERQKVSLLMRVAMIALG